MSVKEWVARVLELNEYLKEFPTVNGAKETKLPESEVMEILEYGVPAQYRREFTVQGFDPLTQGLKKFLEFCSRLESCELTMEKPIPKKVAFQEETVTGSRKRKTLKAEKGSGLRMQYCQLHGENPTHGTAECFELNRRKKRAKEFATVQRHEREEKTRIPYKELNAFINAKVDQALQKRSKAKKAKKASNPDIAINAFEHFRDLEVVNSDEEDRKPEAVKHDSDNDNFHISDYDVDSNV